MSDLKGIMHPDASTQPANSNTFQDMLRQALLGSLSKEESLETRFNAMSAAEQQIILRLANMTRMAASYRRDEPYEEIIGQLFPSLGSTRRSMVFDVLQAVEPRSAKPAEHTVQPGFANDILAAWEALPPLRTREGTPKVAAASAAKPRTKDTGSQNEGADFLSRLVHSESSGKSQASYTTQDGRTFVGLLQFGDARLQDYRQMTGESFTQDEFKADTALQAKVAAWHIADIDHAIDALGEEANGFDRNGLRAVGHLGGKSGMTKYVQSGGAHNPSDELGTSLQEYYHKFSAEEDGQDFVR